MLDRWVDVELVWRGHDAAQWAADIRAGHAQHCGCDPTHGLSAGHDSSRDQTDDETENDQPDDVQDHDESPPGSERRAASVYAASVTMRVLQAGGFGSILLGCGE